MKYFMGIDVGTSSAKTLVLEETGRVLGVCSRAYEVRKPQPGWAEQDMEEIWEAVCETIRELVGKYPEIRDGMDGISFSGQMHGLVLLDKAYRPLRPMINWQDQRSVRQVEEILETVGKENFGRIARNSLSTGFLASSLLWVRENEPEIYAACRYVLLPKDYIRLKMCGEIGTDFSDASGTLLFDTARRDWAWEMIENLGLDRAIFPELHESYAKAGKITAECAAQTGLREGTTVAYGGGDTLMHEVGTGLIAEDSPWVSNIGTSCQVSCASAAPPFDPLLRANTFCHAKGDLWMLMSASLAGGAAMQWAKKRLFPEFTDFEQMNAMAQGVRAGSDGLIFLPYLNGARSPENDPHARAIFFGISLDHDKAHFVRAVMEGVIYSLMHNYETIRAVTHSDTRAMVASGGGAKGDLLLQMQADAFDRPIYTTQESEQSCVGAAVTAALCAGAYASYAEACRELVKFRATVVEPIAQNTRVYREQFETYKELYARNRTLF